MVPIEVSTSSFSSSSSLSFADVSRWTWAEGPERECCSRISDSEVWADLLHEGFLEEDSEKKSSFRVSEEDIELWPGDEL